MTSYLEMCVACPAIKKWHIKIIHAGTGCTSNVSSVKGYHAMLLNWTSSNETNVTENPYLYEISYAMGNVTQIFNMEQSINHMWNVIII